MSEELLGKFKRGKLFVVSAPAGTGKSTLVDLLIGEFPKKIVRSCSATTREPRGEEVDGVDYHFLSKERFQELLAKKAFLEHAKVFEHEYGTLASVVDEGLANGLHTILVIDTKGAMQVRQSRPDSILVFVHPPSMEELEKRLSGRATDSESQVQLRLSHARAEIAMSSKYEYQIVNDDLDMAYQILKSILVAEGHKGEK